MSSFHTSILEDTPQTIHPIPVIPLFLQKNKLLQTLVSLLLRIILTITMTCFTHSRKQAIIYNFKLLPKNNKDQAITIHTIYLKIISNH